MTHTIDITDIRDMIILQVLASAYGRGENKKLTFEYNMYDNAHCWKVECDGIEDVYHNLTDAVDAYNALR